MNYTREQTAIAGALFPNYEDAAAAAELAARLWSGRWIALEVSEEHAAYRTYPGHFFVTRWSA